MLTAAALLLCDPVKEWLKGGATTAPGFWYGGIFAEFMRAIQICIGEKERATYLGVRIENALDFIHEGT